MIEYLISLYLEFFGLIVFSMFIFMVSKVFKKNFTFAVLNEQKLKAQQIWIIELEKSNQRTGINTKLLTQMRKRL